MKIKNGTELEKLAHELAHNQTLKESKGCKDEQDMYVSSEIMKYKPNIKKKYDQLYEYYLETIKKYIKHLD